MSRIVRIAHTYVSGAKTQGLTQEQWMLLRQMLSQEMPEQRPSDLSYVYIRELLTLDEVEILISMGIDITIQKFPGQINLLQHLAPDVQGPTQSVHVHVPNVGMLAMDEVQLLADACTDQLQRELSDGWRILCVCPPNNARRPDYILGRTRPRE